jgi:hypothetical protein
MSPPFATGMGWPFLVAAGRRRDYSTLLAPDFLLADLDHGILDEVVRPTSEKGPAMVIDVRTRGGHRLTVVYATHLLTAADIAAPGTVPDAPTAEPRDEYSRPLRLVYGFVSPDTWIAEPADADLDLARDTALDVYRRFLDDEDTVTVIPAHPFPLRSRVVSRPAVRADGAPAQTPPFPRTAHPSTSPRPRAATDDAVPPRGALRLAGAAIILGLILIAALLIGTWRHPGEPVHTTCPSAVATASPAPASPSVDRSPTCTPGSDANGVSAT